MAWECLSVLLICKNGIINAELTFCISSLLAKSHFCPFVLLALLCIMSYTANEKKEKE